MRTTVMVVDDDEVFLEELSEVLVSRGYEAVAISDSARVVEAAKKTRPALVLMDLRMPGKNGYELASELKNTPELSDIPIIAMSGFFRAKNSMLLELSGILKCLAKPLNPLDVIGTIEETLTKDRIVLNEALGPPEDRRGSLESQSAPPEHPEGIPSKQFILKRFDDLLKEMAGDIDPLTLAKMTEKLQRLKSYIKRMNDFPLHLALGEAPKNVTGRSDVVGGVRDGGSWNKVLEDERTMKGARLMKTITVITKEELKRKIDHGDEVQVVNVLAPDYYHLGSIIGSRKIPLSELDDRMDELYKGEEVVVYCASYECQASKKAAEKLAAEGFDVRAYEGGIKEWKEAGYPTEA